LTSWRDDASTNAQEDLDALLNAALGFAQQELAEHGEFFPYAAAITADGTPEMIAARPGAGGERPRATDVMAACLTALTTKRDEIRAGAIVADVRLAEVGSDAIQVDLEHAEGQALSVLLPYATRLSPQTVEYGQVRAQAGRRRIWGLT
jgi:hypothetical protein